MDQFEYKLYVNDVEAVKGMEVHTFRGQRCTLKAWREPHKESSTGRVYCEMDGTSYEWYPGVIDARFVKGKVM